MKLNKLSAMLSALLGGIVLLAGCSSEGNLNTAEPYDPNKPLELQTFYPDSGKFLEQVILKGSNFGSNPKEIRVYFNKRKAAVIGSTGTELYVLAPRLPGDTCTISVAVGKDSVTYPGKFRYKKSVTVSTIAGNGNVNEVVTGPLSSSQLEPVFLCVDKDNNIFVVCRRNGLQGNPCIMRIDEERDELVMLQKGAIGNVPCADPFTGIITIPTETTLGSFYSLNPQEFWAPRVRDMKWPEDVAKPAEGYKHCMVVNPADGYIYTRYYYGDIIKINPRTYEVTPIYKTGTGNSYGLTFNPLHPNILYISYRDDAGDMASSICSIDVTNPATTYKRLSSSNISGGHRDGPLSEAQFRNPSQIFCDNDGNIYVADRGNHCIRRITPENMVETVLGMPGTKGWKDGKKEDALFNEPTGIGIAQDGSVYVADFKNGRVRKLTIN